MTFGSGQRDDVVAARLQGEGYVLICRPMAFIVAGQIGPLPPEQ
jgi:hypothetical protein